MAGKSGTLEVRKSYKVSSESRTFADDIHLVTVLTIDCDSSIQALLRGQ